MPAKKALPRFGRKSDSAVCGANSDGTPSIPVQQELIPAGAESATPVEASHSEEPNPVAVQAVPIVSATSRPTIQVLMEGFRTAWRRLIGLLIAAGRSLRGVIECAMWLVRFPFRRTPRTPANPRQPDLPRLDDVRVVRNDLTDSDFEVVPRRSSAKAANPFTAASEPGASARKAASAEPVESETVNSE